MKFFLAFFTKLGFCGHTQRTINALSQEPVTGPYDYVGNGIRIRFDRFGNHILYKNLNGKGLLVPVSIVVEDETTYADLNNLAWGDGTPLQAGEFDQVQNGLIFYFKQIQKSKLCFLKEGDRLEKTPSIGHRLFALPREDQRISSKQVA